MLIRKPSQARNGFEIKGITNEIVFSDFRFTPMRDVYGSDLHEFEDSKETHLEETVTDIEFTDGEEAHQCASLIPTVDELSDPNTDAEFDRIEGDSSDLDIWDQRRAAIPDAVRSLTERQFQAVVYYSFGYTERAAAEIMGISQPTYREILFGKAGIGGAMKRLRTALTRDPISPLIVEAPSVSAMKMSG